MTPTAHGHTVATGTCMRMLRYTGTSRQPPRTPSCTYGGVGVMCSVKIRHLFRRLGHPTGFRDTLPPPQASALGTALCRARRTAGGPRVLVCMAQKHEGHAERLDPGYRILENKKKERKPSLGGSTWRNSRVWQHGHETRKNEIRLPRVSAVQCKLGKWRHRGRGTTQCHVSYRSSIGHTWCSDIVQHDQVVLTS